MLSGNTVCAFDVSAAPCASASYRSASMALRQFLRPIMSLASLECSIVENDRPRAMRDEAPFPTLSQRRREPAIAVFYERDGRHILNLYAVPSHSRVLFRRLLDAC